MYRKQKKAKHYYDADKIVKLDELITAGMLHAESKCRNVLRLPWSKEINEVMTKFNILKIHLSNLRNNIDCSKQIEKKEQLPNKENNPPTDNHRHSHSTQKSLARSQDLLRGVPIKKNHATGRPGGSVIASHPNMDPTKATKIFNNAKIASNIFSELPKQKTKAEV